MQAQELRHHFRQLRREFSIQNQSGEAAIRLTVHLRRLVEDLADANTQIGLYRPLQDEAQFELVPPTRFFYPKVEGHEIQFYRPHTAFAFACGAFGISEPLTEQSDVLNPNAPAIIFCPAVAVDWCGHRIGMGKGYYDRFFARFPQAVRVGVVYQVQVASDPLPAESWDQALDWIVTEEMILRTSNRSS